MAIPPPLFISKNLRPHPRSTRVRLVTSNCELSHIQSCIPCLTSELSGVCQITSLITEPLPGSGCTETAFHEGCRTSFPVCGALCSRVPGVSGGARLCCSQDLRAIWALSRGGNRRNRRAPGEVCRAPNVRELPLGYCRYQNQGRACACELRGVPRCALSESAGTAAAQVDPLRAFRGLDRSSASPPSSYPSPRGRSHIRDPGQAGHSGAVRPLSHGQRGQAQRLSASRPDGSYGRSSLRNLS